MSKKNIKSGSKNNISNRGQGAKVKLYNGKKIIPILYKSHSNTSNTSYVAAKLEDGTLVVDSAGNPVPYSSIMS